MRTVAAGLRIAVAALASMCTILPATAAQGLGEACGIGYVLQAEGLGPSRAAVVQRLGMSGRDVLVLDAWFTAGDGISGRWRTEELEQMRGAKRGRVVVSYLSIGEAEDYRAYWQPDWQIGGEGGATPDFLVAANPDWPGNYKVRYWDTRWQDIILEELDRIVTQGFDGVYLDIVDAFSFFEFDPATGEWLDDRPNPETGNSYRRDMANWVQRIARHGRARRPGFFVIPQNGAQLLALDDYVAAVDAIAVEDLYTVGDQPQTDEHTAYVSGYLKRMKRAGKPAFTVEYATRRKWRQRAKHLARHAAYPLLLTDRALRTLGQSFPSPGCGEQP